jgi:hypothetical protein
VNRFDPIVGFRRCSGLKVEGPYGRDESQSVGMLLKGDRRTGMYIWELKESQKLVLGR